MEFYKLARSVEKIVNSDAYTRPYEQIIRETGEQRRNYSLRGHMSERLGEVLSEYLRRETRPGSRSMYHQSDAPLDVDLAKAICFPEALSEDELSQILILLGDYFRYTGQETHLAHLLKLFPGGPGIHIFCKGWVEEMRIRREVIPHGRVVELEYQRIRNHLGNGSIHSREKFAKKNMALGYEEISDPKAIKFYFADPEVAALFALQYA